MAFVVIESVLAIIHWQVGRVNWLHRVRCECVGRRADVLVLAVKNVVVHWMRLLFVRVSLDDLIDHLFLVFFHHAVRHVANVPALGLVHAAEPSRDDGIHGRGARGSSIRLLLTRRQMATLVPDLALLEIGVDIFCQDARRGATARLLVGVENDCRAIVEVRRVRSTRITAPQLLLLNHFLRVACCHPSDSSTKWLLFTLYFFLRLLKRRSLRLHVLLIVFFLPRRILLLRLRDQQIAPPTLIGLGLTLHYFISRVRCHVLILKLYMIEKEQDLKKVKISQ